MAIFGKETTTPSSQQATAAPPGVDSDRVSRLGRGIVVSGKIEGSENLRLEGRLEGEIDLKADLTIGASAEIRARVHARSITVEGSVYGDLSADGRVDLVRTARVEGTITAPKISIAEGAQFEGKIDMSMRKGSGKPD